MALSFDCDARKARFVTTDPLAKCEVDYLNTGIKKLELDGPVLHWAFLSDQLTRGEMRGPALQERPITRCFSKYLSWEPVGDGAWQPFSPSQGETRPSFSA